MEDKLKRECKTYVEKAFKKYEQFGSGAMKKDDVRHLLQDVIPEFNYEICEEELMELLSQYLKASKYTEFNKTTKKMEMKLLQNTVDFPSVLAITIYYLKKIEHRESNAFAAKNVIKVKDFMPLKDQLPNGVSSGPKETKIKKKMF